MAKARSTEQLKAHLERLRTDSVEVVSNASRIVVEGVQKLAEQELKALNDYYKGAVKSAKQAKDSKTSKAYQDMASEQIDLLQDTVQKVLSNARESLGIIAETRAELARLTQAKPESAVSKSFASVSDPARKAVDEVRKAASKAQKSAADTAKSLRKTLEKELTDARKKAQTAAKDGQATARKAGRRVRRQLDTVLDVQPPRIVKKSVDVRPSSTSRAARAARKPAGSGAEGSTAKAAASKSGGKSSKSGKATASKKGGAPKSSGHS